MSKDYFGLQLDVAAHYASTAGVPLSTAMVYCTNLRRRLDLWGPAGESRWNGFLAQVRSTANPRSVALFLSVELYETRSRARPAPFFGCFSYDPPDATGVLRMHFMPPADTRTSPLASESIGVRQDELRAMFTHVRRVERNVATVRGVSWLYNLAAYKRLFPAAYSASNCVPRFPVHLNGSSTWGQVLSWRQEVKPAVRDEVLARLPAMKTKAAWDVFPYRALLAECHVGAFFEMFT